MLVEKHRGPGVQTRHTPCLVSRFLNKTEVLRLNAWHSKVRNLTLDAHGRAAVEELVAFGARQPKERAHQELRTACELLDSLQHVDLFDVQLSETMGGFNRSESASSGTGIKIPARAALELCFTLHRELGAATAVELYQCLGPKSAASPASRDDRA